ncbi:MAG: hypothetical protein KGK07_11905 [Chloroflexota bacterium]|nr:hypothetical protein [Chloroflexota bacterium]
MWHGACTLNGLDSSGPIPGYFDSPFPAEDGGPRRQLIPRSPGLALQPGESLEVTSRPALFANMVILRRPGEVFVQGNSQPWEHTTSWVERIDPVSLATLARSTDLPGGPFWAGGILAHENGYLYVTYGRFCHKLDAGCNLVASRELPRPHPYNSLLALSDGNLVMKDFVRDGSSRSHFSVLDAGRLEPVGPEVAVPEGSIARISSDRASRGECVYVVGDHTIFRYRYEGGTLSIDDAWRFRYRTRPPTEQSYGWDPVIADGCAWFMDNGENNYRGSFRDAGVGAGPLHLIRVPLSDPEDADVYTPFGLPHGTIVNPPLIDASRRIAVAYDSGNARIAGFRYGRGTFERLWEHAFGASNHFLLFPDTGEIVVNDFDGHTEHVVALNIETGAELARVATGSPVQAALFQSPGWARDVYTCTFTTLSRTFVAP